jgi:hypothetical protein
MDSGGPGNVNQGIGGWLAMTALGRGRVKTRLFAVTVEYYCKRLRNFG